VGDVIEQLEDIIREFTSENKIGSVRKLKYSGGEREE
jgi:hypothetical protein